MSWTQVTFMRTDSLHVDIRVENGALSVRAVRPLVELIRVQLAIVAGDEAVVAALDERSQARRVVVAGRSRARSQSQERPDAEASGPTTLGEASDRSSGCEPVKGGA